MQLTTRFAAQLPEWVAGELAGTPDRLPDVEDRMRLVHRLADRNHREGTGGPFAAAVSDTATGEILSVGVNLVLATNLSTMHAEVVALCLAQARLRTWDLGGPGSTPVELTVNWRPCAMCYGAVLWSGIERLVIAGEGDEIEQLTGFDEGPMRADWKEQFRLRGIEVRTDVLREQALAVFRAYGQRTDATVYNSRRRQSAPVPDVVTGR
jgi:tRNA(Arg) A34 adenosine deaminase TadA